MYSIESKNVATQLEVGSACPTMVNVTNPKYHRQVPRIFKGVPYVEFITLQSYLLLTDDLLWRCTG